MSSPLKKFLIKQINHTTSKCNGAVIFFHGSGDSGTGIREWLKSLLGKDFSFPHLDVIIPTAPARPYTPNGGALSNVWFDRYKISQDVSESDSVITMCKDLDPLVKSIVDRGIPKSRIVIGGFSMGGCLAMHMAYRYHEDIAGCFVLSGFLNHGSAVYESVRKAEGQVPPLFYAHGKDDLLVPYEWGVKTHDELQKLGVKTEFHTFENLDHSLDLNEVQLLKKWIIQQVGEDS